MFRIGSFIPVPGIDPEALADLFEQQRGTILDMFNMFSGGALSRFSLFAIGIMPYISASIIMQLLTVVHPKLEQLKKEGEAGRRKITQYTRYGTVALATFQALGVAIALEAQSAGGSGVVIDPGLGFRITAVVTLVTGTIFLMWLGEQVSERGIGNGISIIIFAGIVAGLPSAVGGTLELARTGELHVLLVLLLLVLALAVTGFVVCGAWPTTHYRQLCEASDGAPCHAGANVPFTAEIEHGRCDSAHICLEHHLVSVDAAGWFGSTDGMEWLSDIAQTLSPGQPLYVMFYAAAIIFFCFFYTALVFNPKDTADNLKKSGAFIPGVRPGDQTAKYIDGVMTKLTVAGAAYITAVCLLPEFMILQWNVPFYFGGTSLLIIVVVVMDFMAQLQSHMVSHQYEGMLKKANLKGFGSSGMPR